MPTRQSLPLNPAFRAMGSSGGEDGARDRAGDVAQALHALANLLGHDTARRLCALYQSRMPDIMKALETASAACDAQALRRATHDLVTNAGTMGFMRLAAEARAAEETAARGDVAAVQARVPALVAAIAASFPVVDAWIQVA